MGDRSTNSPGTRSQGFGERTLPTYRAAAAGPEASLADECATVLATCLRPRRTGRGLERPKTAERCGLVDGTSEREAQAESLQCISARIVSVPCRARRRSSDGGLRGVEPDGLPTAGSGSPDERVKGSGCPRRAARRGAPPRVVPR